jgi:hypothetical protein
VRLLLAALAVRVLHLGCVEHLRQQAAAAVVKLLQIHQTVQDSEVGAQAQSSAMVAMAARWQPARLTPILAPAAVVSEAAADLCLQRELFPILAQAAAVLAVLLLRAEIG